MAKGTGETYELRTYADFMALSDDQFDHMVEDFKTWKKYHSKLMGQLKPIAEMSGCTVSDMVELPDCFTWIDDNKHEGTIITEIKTEDGEVISTFESTVRPEVVL